jgi:hypothetical protein
MADAPAPLELEPLNARVYAELFLTPASDPWLGLFAPDTYAVLAPKQPAGESHRRSTAGTVNAKPRCSNRPPGRSA